MAISHSEQKCCSSGSYPVELHYVEWRLLPCSPRLMLLKEEDDNSLDAWRKQQGPYHLTAGLFRATNFPWWWCPCGLTWTLNLNHLIQHQSVPAAWSHRQTSFLLTCLYEQLWPLPQTANYRQRFSWEQSFYPVTVNNSYRVKGVKLRGCNCSYQCQWNLKSYLDVAVQRKYYFIVKCLTDGCSHPHNYKIFH